MKRMFTLTVLVALLALLFAVPLAAQGTPTIEVMDQTVQDSTVTISRVVATQPGWVVIHIDQDGKPGPVIGHAAVPAGESTDVKVQIDVSQATERLWAMLHVDAGTMGEYEFPGPDAPVKVGDEIVMAPFNVSLPVLPTTGGQSLPIPLLAVVVGAGLLLAGLGVWRFSQA